MAGEFIVIGIHESSDFAAISRIHALEQYKVFSGGTRHYELVKSWLPEEHCYIEIKGSMKEVFEQYECYPGPVVVFASGDPWFYGFANTIRKYAPAAAVTTFPAFNSLQLLCHKACTDYSSLSAVSVHGRSWARLDEALIKGSPLIGVLTDKEKSPAAVAARMLEYNFLHYKVIVGEALESKEEKVRELSLQQAAQERFNDLNCMLLVRTSLPAKYFGIADHLFEGLPGRPNMITKMPVRLLTLAALGLANAACFWDIGFCTGSISVEAKLQFPHLDIVAFEKREECDAILDMNTRRFSTPGITKVTGDFFNADLSRYPRPDAVFIGGHGNRLTELMTRVHKVLQPGGRIVINAVKEESREEFIAFANKAGLELSEPITMKVNEHNAVSVLTAVNSDQ